MDQSSPIGDIGSPGVFTKEIQRAILSGEADVAVHSLKDLPTDLVPGLLLAAVPERESAPTFWFRTLHRLSTICRRAPASAQVACGGRRNCVHARPDLQVMPIRGNVDTRLRKLDEGQFDALVLAEAGLKRLGFANRISHVLPLDVMLPAVGQGALGIECRDDDASTRAALTALDDSVTHAAVLAERALLAHLRGGCLAPIGAIGRATGNQIELSAVVLSPGRNSTSS